MLVLARGSFKRSVLVGMLLLGLLTGCSNNPYPEDSSGKNVLHLGLRDDPNTLDPSASFVPTIVDSLHPAYFEYDYLKRDPLRLNLALGAELPTITPRRLPDGRMGETWSF